MSAYKLKIARNSLNRVEEKYEQLKTKIIDMEYNKISKLCNTTGKKIDEINRNAQNPF